MKNHEQWQPSKFIQTESGLRASRDPKVVALSSRFVADILAAAYENLISEHARGVLVDLGCGKVPLFEVYRPMAEEIICVDWANSPHSINFVDVESNLNVAIDLPANSTDTILATDVLEHISAPERFWSEMVRILRPGGKIIMGVPFLYPIHEIPHDFCRYTHYKLTDFVEQNNLELIQLEPYGGWPEVIVDMVGKLISQRPILLKPFLALSERFLRTSYGRKLSANTARRFPLGYTLVAMKLA